MISASTLKKEEKGTSECYWDFAPIKGWSSDALTLALLPITRQLDAQIRKIKLWPRLVIAWVLIANQVNAHLRFRLTFFRTATTFFLLIGSQAMPTSMPPPRKLPQRSWAASIPTILTHSALNVLLLPSPTPGLVPGLAGSYLCSPLERFLGSVIMRRHLQRIIQQETVCFRMF